jgi:hypothetical protein
MCQIYTQSDRWTGISIKPEVRFGTTTIGAHHSVGSSMRFMTLATSSFFQFGLQRREQVYRHASWRVHSEWHRIRFKTYSVLTRHAAQTFEPVGVFDSRIETGIGVDCIDGGEADCGFKRVDSITTQKRLVGRLGSQRRFESIDGHATEDAR